MKIAVIGWGSLIWDPCDLPKEGTWQEDGPDLPIEFSRISRDARLTLVIDQTDGKTVKALYVLSPRTALDDAREDLRKREQTSDENIGWVDIVGKTDSYQTYPKQANVHEIIKKWCQEHRYDAAVWTALTSNFRKETDREFSVVAAMEYLAALPKNVRKEALRYIKNAPDCVDTPVRKETEKRFALRQAER
jgi:hypothetical protein